VIQFFLVVLMALAAAGLLIGVLALLGYAFDDPPTRRGDLGPSIPGGSGMVRGETPRPHGGHETPPPPGAT